MVGVGRQGTREKKPRVSSFFGGSQQIEVTDRLTLSLLCALQ